ncbi:DUF5686 family protein [Candidatus Latescibacterota bacterium]
MKYYKTYCSDRTANISANCLIPLIFIFFVLMFVLPGKTPAQNPPMVIHGIIRDSDNNKPLTAAHIRIEGTRSGTISNDEGEYNLEIPSLPSIIVISIIGYNSVEKTITSDTPEPLDILLEPRLYILPTVVVTSGNLAETIMRRVIERKKVWYAKLENYKADAYSRINLANEKEIALISESISVLFWDKERGIKEVTTFTNSTKNIPFGESITSARMVPNLYDDDIELFGYNMVGLTHPEALDYYTFSIIENKVLDDKTVYVMSVEPKSKLQPLFRGTVAVLDEDYAMIDLDLNPNEAVIYPSPLEKFEFSVKQQFSNFGEDVWLPVDVRMNGRIKIKMGFLIELPMINISQVSHFSDYDINTVLPDSLYETETVKHLDISISNENISVDTYDETKEIDSGETKTAADDTKLRTAIDKNEDESLQESIPETKPDELSLSSQDSNVNDKSSDTIDSQSEPVLSEADSLALAAQQKAHQDSLFALKRNAIPFTTEEDKAYSTIDSSMTIEKAFKPSGLLTKLIKEENTEDNTNNNNENNESEPKEKSKLSRAISKITTGMGPVFWNNRVDGYHLGLNWKKRYKNCVRYNFGGAYKTSIERWSWNAETELFFSDKQKKSFILNVSAGTQTRQIARNYPLWLNTALTLGGFNDYYDYYWNEKIRAGFRYKFKNNMELVTAFNNERHDSLQQSSFYDLTGKKGRMRVNPAVNEGNLRSVSMQFTFGQKYSPITIGGSKGVEFSIEHSSPEFLESSYTFTQFKTDIVWRFETYLKRRLFPMTLDIRFIGSASTGKLPIQRFASVDSRFLFWTPFGAFRSLSTRPLEGEHHAALFVEHNFRTVPFELIGLRSIAEKNIGIILHGAAGRTWISADRLKTLPYVPHYYNSIVSEAGISINNLFGFFRLDYTKRLDRDGYTFGINIARIM